MFTQTSIRIQFILILGWTSQNWSELRKIRGGTLAPGPYTVSGNCLETPKNLFPKKYVLHTSTYEKSSINSCKNVRYEPEHIARRSFKTLVSIV